MDFKHDLVLLYVDGVLALSWPSSIKLFDKILPRSYQHPAKILAKSLEIMHD